ncbi:hypothetical protein BamMEX5DRAFT_5807 [Burkholderia ambifaria MEX-5]|uniref:Uncharacterized protein n=1 Tax=Burkholderia ambifaria MEX-5 TaxID=396597 RepID=B1TDE1_9BURK|nr:hypothetical protein BamMEX5DRAFT_5807 [Burkholderia ambifaria MEX-5]
MYVLRDILAKRGTVIMEKETIFSLGHVKELNADAKSYSDPGKVRRASF